MDKTTLLWTTLGTLAVGALVIGGSIWARSGPSPSADMALAADDHVKGATTTPQAVVIEYLDFECPTCGAFYPVVKQLEAEYGDRVAFAVRYFPITSHANGRTSAYAAEAAGLQGAFWPMHDLLFERQEQWASDRGTSAATFEGYAAELGLDIERFRADAASDEVRARVDRDASQGRAYGVAGTPTFFLDGEKLRTPGSLEAFRAVLDAKVGPQAASTSPEAAAQ